MHFPRRRCLLLLSPRSSDCIMFPEGGICCSPKANSFGHTLHWVHWKWSSVRKRVGRRSRPLRSQRTDWKKIPHVLRTKDAQRSLTHAVTHSAASQQGLQHAVAQAGSSASLFRWRVDVGRGTNILHRFRLQRRSEAWPKLCGPLGTSVERSLDVNHGEGRRQTPRFHWGGTTSNRRKGECFSNTGWFPDGLMFGRPC